jgi:hypothetical protein
MDRTSQIARWPWRKWLLAGTAMAGSATIVGPVAVEGAFGCSSCAAVAQCPCLCDACAAVGPCAAILRDSATEDVTEDVTVDQAADAPSTTDANVDGGDSGAPDGHEDALSEE